ncbi:hypothetical protein CCP4SC76_1260001 [Gammaproteobacteria bacterium]
MNGMATMASPQRCAVYTRKSTDEGLEQDYNSIEAQRDAGLGAHSRFSEFPDARAAL